MGQRDRDRPKSPTPHIRQKGCLHDYPCSCGDPITSWAILQLSHTEACRRGVHLSCNTLLKCSSEHQHIRLQEAEVMHCNIHKWLDKCSLYMADCRHLYIYLWENECTISSDCFAECSNNMSPKQLPNNLQYTTGFQIIKQLHQMCIGKRTIKTNKVSSTDRKLQHFY